MGQTMAGVHDATDGNTTKYMDDVEANPYKVYVHDPKKDVGIHGIHGIGMAPASDSWIRPTTENVMSYK